MCISKFIHVSLYTYAYIHIHMHEHIHINIRQFSNWMHCSSRQNKIYLVETHKHSTTNRRVTSALLRLGIRRTILH